MSTVDIPPRIRMPLALVMLTFSCFGIGTSEFLVLGLLPEVSSDLHIPIATAGWLVTGYAVAIAVGAPVVAVLTATLPRKRSLLVLMGVFIAGNVLCALATSFPLMIIARVITALGQGAFFGIGAVMAASLVPHDRKASAISTMFLGLTLANVAGVPLGTALGHWAGWRAPFWFIAVVGGVGLVGLWVQLPDRHDEEKLDIVGEIRSLRNAGLWSSLLTAALFTMATFILFTYVAPMLKTQTGLSPNAISASLLLLGLGLTVGNIAGGRMADWNLGRALTLIGIGTAIISVLLRWTGAYFVPAEANWILWGAITFAAIPALQISVMRFAHGAPNLASTLNIGAFNAGIALGARAGGVVLESGGTLDDLPIAAFVLALVTIASVRMTERMARRQLR